MKTKNEEFEVLIPNLDGTAVAERVKINVPLRWDDELEEWLLTPEAHEKIENTKARRIGLLLPAQLKELRERYNYSQKEMGELFQIGEKSWTRWESGKHRPSRVINLTIRALYDGEISINYLLKRAGKPPREVQVVPETDAAANWLLSHLTSGAWGDMANSCKVVVACHTNASGKSMFIKQIVSPGPMPAPQLFWHRAKSSPQPVRQQPRFDTEIIRSNTPSLA